MVIYCKTCRIALTKELQLYEGKSFGEADGQDFIQKGFYTISDGEFFTATESQIIINIEDLINTKNHTDASRLNGCCGLDGCAGNKICKNGHEIGTKWSDCWMPKAVIFETKNIIVK